MTVYLKVSEVAKELRISNTTAYQWAREGVFPAVRLTATTVRVPEKEFRAWLAQRPAANA